MIWYFIIIQHHLIIHKTFKNWHFPLPGDQVWVKSRFSHYSSGDPCRQVSDSRSGATSAIPAIPHNWPIVMGKNDKPSGFGVPEILRIFEMHYYDLLWHYDIYYTSSRTQPKKGRRTFSIFVYSVCFQDVNHRIAKQAFDPCPKVGTI